jgi:hypothetical protein
MSRLRLHFCKPILDDVLGIACLHGGAAAEQVRVTSIAPSVDCGEIEISGCRVRLWKAPRYKVGKRRIELGKRFAKAAGGHLWRNVARFNAEAHGIAEKSS